MADFDGKIRADYVDDRKLVKGGDHGGAVRRYYDEIDTTVAMTTNDRIFIGQLGPGERFLGGKLYHGAMGSGRTVNIGDADDVDRFGAAISVAAEGVTDIQAKAGFGYRNTTQSAVNLFMTLAGGTFAAETNGLRISYLVGRD